MKSAGKARNNGLYRHIRTSKEIIRNLLNDSDKNKNAHGCYALKTRHGKHLAEMKKRMNRQAAEKGIQLVTISRPMAYGEYAPYTFVNDENEFENAVKNMLASIEI